MLIDFRVRNYRSIRNECNFSLVASSDKTLRDTNTRDLAGASLPSLLVSSVVYGANASGKTNLLRGLNLMKAVVLESASLQPNQPYNVQPFLLDKNTAGEPTMFEITIVINDVRFQYGFEFTAGKIVAEWLMAYQNFKPQLWFDRRIDNQSGSTVYKFSKSLTGQKKIWEEATRPNALYLSTAVQLNSESLKPIHDWFASYVSVFLDGGHIPHHFSTDRLLNVAEQVKITNFLSSADTAISSVTAQSAKGRSGSIVLDLATGNVSTHTEDGDILVPKFKHTNNDVDVDFDLGDESQGTQKLFALSGVIFDVLERGSLLAIDELDRSLHPHLVRKIVEIFQNPEVNKKGAQLIFTTHDTTLLDTSLLRRDQIWFAEKMSDQSSELVPLSDFSPRKGEAIEKGYLAGRYGGVPILPFDLVRES
jgi:uncharacterized protein